MQSFSHQSGHTPPYTHGIHASHPFPPLLHSAAHGSPPSVPAPPSSTPAYLNLMALTHKSATANRIITFIFLRIVNLFQNILN